MDKIAEFLIEKETITGKEFMEIFHRVRGDQEPPAETSGMTVENQA
jgi:cell division protease FtsH